MNILLAVGIVTVVFMVHYSHDWYQDQPARVGWVSDNSAAAKAGIKPDDVIVKIDGLPDPLWEDVNAKIAISPGQPLPVVVKRGDALVNATLIPMGSSKPPIQPLLAKRPVSVMPATAVGKAKGRSISAST